MRVSLDKSARKISRKITGFMFARYFFAKLFIGFIASTIILVLFSFNIFEKFELVTLDQRFRLRPARQTDSNIVLIDMSDDSIEAIGRWPWPRQWHATLLSILKEYGAKLVIFDIIFDEPSSPSQDLVFEEALKRAGNVYLPFVFQFREGDTPASAGDPENNVRNIIRPLKSFSDVSKPTKITFPASPLS